MKCSICGTDNEKGVGYCRHCGVSIAQAAPAAAPPAAATAVCPTCRCIHAMPARFCDQCGTRLPSDVVVHRAADAMAAPLHRSAPQRAAAADAAVERHGQSRASTSAGEPLAATAGSVAAAPSMALSPSFNTTFIKPVARWLPAIQNRIERRFGVDRDRQRKRRFWQLLIGTTLVVALILFGVFWMARTLMVGEPPWKEPAARKLPDAALLAAAARRMEPQPEDALQNSPALSLPPTVEITRSSGRSDTIDGQEPVRKPNGADAVSGPDGLAAESPQSTPDDAAKGPDQQAAPSSSPTAPHGENAQAAEAPLRAKSAVPPNPKTAPRHALPPVQRGGTVRSNGASSGASDSPLEMADNGEPETMVAPLLPEQDKTGRARPPVRNEQRPARVAQAPSQQNWYGAMKSQLNRCADDPNIFSRVICAEQAKFRYCSPNRWGQVAECVKTQYRDISTINEKSGRWMAYSRHERFG